MADAETYDKLAKVLKDIRERYPDDAFSKHQRLKGLLADHLPDAAREIRIVLDAIDEGVVSVLTDTPQAERGMQVDRLVLRLETARGIREDIARRVVQAFAYSLGVGALPSTIAVAQPSPPAAPPAPAAGGEWIGVSEIASPQNHSAPGAPSGQAASATPVGQFTPSIPSADATGATQTGTGQAPAQDAVTALKSRLGEKKGVAIAVVAAVVVIGYMMTEQPDTEPPPQQQGTAPIPPQGGQPTVSPQGGPQPGSPQGGPQPQPVVNQPSVQPQPQPVVNQPPQQPSATSTAAWYDPYGIVWSMTFQGNRLRGQANVGGTMMQMDGQIDPQTNGIVYQLSDAASQVVGQGQGQFTDPTHVSFVTYDMNGFVVGQGQFHINHAP